MALRCRAGAGWDLADVHVGEVAAAEAMRVGAERAHARPRRDLEREQIEAEVLTDRNALGHHEVAIGIREELWLRCIAQVTVSPERAEEGCALLRIPTEM